MAAELIFRRGAPPDAEYTFKHALVQDAAYDTLLRGKRQELHARVATVLEQRFADVVKRQPELLARHLTAAGETRRAIEWWLEAGKQTARRSGHAEAIAHFEQALALLPLLPEAPDRDNEEMEIQTARGMSLIVARGAGSIEAAEAYGRATELCEKHGSHRHLFCRALGLVVSEVRERRQRGCHRCSQFIGQAAGARAKATRCRAAAAGSSQRVDDTFLLGRPGDDHWALPSGLPALRYGAA